MRPPIVLRSEGDLEVFDSKEAAERSAEVIDVQDEIYRAWDAEGRRLRLTVELVRTERTIGSRKIERVILVEDEPQPTHQDELRQVLTHYLNTHNPEEGERRSLSLSHLLAEARNLYLQS